MKDEKIGFNCTIILSFFFSMAFFWGKFLPGVTFLRASRMNSSHNSFHKRFVNVIQSNYNPKISSNYILSCSLAGAEL